MTVCYRWCLSGLSGLLLFHSLHAAEISIADSIPDSELSGGVTHVLLSAHLVSFLTLEKREGKEILLTLDSDDKPINNKLCQITIAGFEPVHLALEPPCYFFVDPESKEPPKHIYDEEGIKAMLLMGGSRIVMSAKEQSYLKLPHNQYCSSAVQAFLVTNDGFKLSGVQKNTPACVSELLDEKLYHFLSKTEKTSIELTKKMMANNKESLTIFDELIDRIKKFLN